VVKYVVCFAGYVALKVEFTDVFATAFFGAVIDISGARAVATGVAEARASKAYSCAR